MTPAFKPYPAYKDSGLPWLGKVPRHWTMCPALACYEPKQVRNDQMQETKVLSLSYGHIIVKPADKLHGLVPASFATYQIADKGDIIIRPTDLQNDRHSLRVGHVGERGIITSAYLCLKSVSPMSSAFGFRYLSAWDLTKAIYGYGGGLRQSLDFAHFKRMPVPVPPREEQDRIVRFLDSQVAKINRLVKIKKRQIALLKELKQATINRAVTRGLDPSFPSVESGVEGIGKIPKGWTVCPLKSVADSNLHTLQEDERPEFQFKYLDIGSVGFNEIKTDPCVITFADAPSRARRKVNVGDTIISTVRTYLKSLAYISESLDGIIVSTGFSVLTPNTSAEPELLHYLLAADYFIASVIKNSLGISYPAINDARLMSLSVIVPDQGAQRTILEYLQHECVKYDRLIENEKLQIDKLVEYRTRLIADVVTGKLDVRDVAVSEKAGPCEDSATVDDDEAEEADAESAEGDPDDATARLEVAE